MLQVILETYGNKIGPLHGLKVNTPYVTKDHLQQKRFTAQSHGTTYVYDYPEVFCQVTMAVVCMCVLLITYYYNIIIITSTTTKYSHYNQLLSQLVSTQIRIRGPNCYKFIIALIMLSTNIV